jgi:Raf kinase inhibitor-like YbhB/YbcL family protein
MIGASIANTAEDAMALTITSTAFGPDGAIPSPYTCEGRDISPPLAWNDVPTGTKSLVLIVDDPDAPDPAAPKMTWVHWVLYNVPADAKGLPEAVMPSALPAGTREGVNDWKRKGYGGPCPPIGRHRYFHKLYALDTMLPELDPPNKPAVESAMRGHILAQAVLMGTYQKR